MTPEVYKFRGAILGGFNRRDVTQYIERTAREQRAQIEALTKQLEEAEQEKAALAAALEGLETQSGSLADQEAKVRASLEESTRTLTGLRGDLQTTQAQLAAAKKELSDFQAKVGQLEPLAQRYEALKDRVATVELDAHRKAQATMDEAAAQAEEIKRGAVQWLADLTGSYEALWREVDACARQAAQTRQAFADREAAYRELLRQSGLDAPDVPKEEEA